MCLKTPFKGRNSPLNVLYLLIMVFVLHEMANGGISMAISYKKLWHILLDRDLYKKDLISIAGISEYTVKKLSRNENVSTEVLGRISKALNCTIDDIVEFTED